MTKLVKPKSCLKSLLQVEIPWTSSYSCEVTLLDGCALLWNVSWPAKGTVRDFVNKFVSSLRKFLESSDTYLVFDRYKDNSIKSVTRKARSGQASQQNFNLSLSTALPSQKSILNNINNKIQLISLICNYIQDQPSLLAKSKKKLIVTGMDPTPFEICKGLIIQRGDLQNMHEEADVILVNQAVHAAKIGVSGVKVIADETDIFVLLLHFYLQENLSCDFVMASTSSRKLIDIKETVAKHKNVISNIVSAHALSGCDTVSGFYGIGKSTVFKVLKAGKQLKLLGDSDTPLTCLYNESARFLSSCYGYPDEENMETLRFRVWSNKMANSKLNSAPQLKILPPTQSVFELHVARAHLQAAIWKGSLKQSPPDLDPLSHGWSNGPEHIGMVPLAIPYSVSPVPEEILKMIKCGCSSMSRCSSMRCSCSSARLSCSLFCSCHADESCINK